MPMSHRRTKLMEESGTTGGNILPGGIEIACVPRVCHVVRVVGMIHQQRYLVLGIGTDDALDAAQVGVIHGDDKVVIVVVGTRHLAGGFSLATDAIFGQLAAGVKKFADSHYDKSMRQLQQY